MEEMNMNALLQGVIDDCHAHRRDLTYQYLHPPFVHHRILSEYFDVITTLLVQQLALIRSEKRPPLVNYVLSPFGESRLFFGQELEGAASEGGQSRLKLLSFFRQDGRTSSNTVLAFRAPVYPGIRNLTYALSVSMKPTWQAQVPRAGLLRVGVGEITCEGVDGTKVSLRYADIAQMRLTFSDPTTIVSPGARSFVFTSSHLYGIDVTLPDDVAFYIDCLDMPGETLAARCVKRPGKLFAALRDPANATRRVSSIIVAEGLEFEFEAMVFSELVYYLDKNRAGPPAVDDEKTVRVAPLTYRNIDELFATPADDFATSLRPKASVKSTAARLFVAGLLDKLLPFLQFCRLEERGLLVSVSTRRFDFSLDASYSNIMYFARCPYHGMYVIREKARRVGFFFVYEYRRRPSTRAPVLIDFRFMSEKLYITHHFTFFASQAFAALDGDTRREIARLAGAGLGMSDEALDAYVPFRDVYEPAAPTDAALNSNDEYSLINFLKLVDGIDGWITHDRAVDLTEVFCMNVRELMEPVGASLFDVRPAVDNAFELVQTGEPAAKVPDEARAWELSSEGRVATKNANAFFELLMNAVGTNPMWLKCGGFATVLLRHPLRERDGLLARFDYDRFYNARPSMYRVFNMRRWLRTLAGWIDSRLDTCEGDSGRVSPRPLTCKLVYVPAVDSRVQIVRYFFSPPSGEALEVVILIQAGRKNVALAAELQEVAAAGGVVTRDVHRYLRTLLGGLFEMKAITMSFYKVSTIQ